MILDWFSVPPEPRRPRRYTGRHRAPAIGSRPAPGRRTGPDGVRAGIRRPARSIARG